VPAAMILLLLLAFGLRVYGICFGTPFEGFYWWDERSAITRASGIAADPSLSSLRLGPYSVLLSAVYYPLSIMQNHTWNPRAISLISLSDRLLIGRALSVLAGTLLVGVVYVLGRRLAGRWGGLSAALLTAVSPTLVAESRYATTGMSGLLLVYLALLPLTDRRILLWKRLFLSSLVAFLAMLTKSNGIVAFALPPLWLATETFASPDQGGRRRLKLIRGGVLLGVVLSGLLFAVWLVNPGGLPEYLRRALSYARIQRAGASPLAAWQWMLRYEWPLLLGGTVGTILGILRRDRLAGTLLFAIFVTLYAAVVSSFGTLFVRWLMIILPGLAILTGSAVAAAVAMKRPLARILAGGFLSVTVVFGTANAWQMGYNLLHDARIATWEWAQEQLPVGAKIAMEGHALPIGDPVFTRYRIQVVRRAVDEPPSYYAENGLQYILTADDIYDRWQAHPEAHPEEMKAYQALFEEYDEIARFHGTLLHAPPAIDIRVLRVADVPLRAVDQLSLGAGWYEAERDDASGTEYRWMTDEGEVFYNWSGEGDARQMLSFDAQVFGEMGDITVYVNNQPEVRLSLDATEAPHHIEIPLRLTEGLNAVEFVSERGCDRPIVYDPDNRDTRCISIRVGNLKLDGR
jgi:hypothetical protein